MEVFGILIAIGFAGYILVGPLIALIRSSAAGRQARQNQEQQQKLIQRIHELENQVQQLRSQFEKSLGTVQAAKAEFQKPAAAREPSTPVTPQPLVTTPLPAPGTELPQPAAGPTQPPAPPAAAPETLKPSGPPAAPPPAKLPDLVGPPAPVVSAQVPSIPTPRFEMLGASKPAPREAVKRVMNIEEVLGTNWLNKLGVIGIVIGLALIMAREMGELGPAGRVLAGFAVGAAFLGAGIFYERSERWRILARAGMGGGWALLYFTTYAMNHVAAARVLKSEPADFVLLMIVAAAMVAHTLRYNSRVITGLAFLLAFSTINISRAGPTSLFASAILAAALVVIVVKRRWFDLEVLAIAAIYLNHFYWLSFIIQPMGEHHHPFPEFMPSAALLIFYWLIFRVSYIVRRIPGPVTAGAGTEAGTPAPLHTPEVEENISTLAAILNSALFLTLMKYQSVHPEWAFRFLLLIGAIEFTLGQLPVTRRRRMAFIVLSTLGVILVGAAWPFKYSGLSLSILWLAEAEALFLAGVFTPEILFRWLGIAIELVVAGHMFIVDVPRLGELRDAQAADFSDPRRATVFFFAALIIFANAHAVPWRWPELLKTEAEKNIHRLQSYLGGLLLMAAVWAVCTEFWLAAAFAATALVLAVAGSSWKFEELSALAAGFAALTFLRALCANFALVDVWHFDARAVGALSLTVALLYFASRWLGYPEPARRVRVSEACTWLSTILLALLAWYQLWPASVALGWALLGLVIFQHGFQRRSFSLRLQSYLLFLASFLRVFFVNFNAEQMVGQLSPRIYSAVPLALLFYYVYARLDNERGDFLSMDKRLRVAGLHCYLGTLTVAAAMRFELSSDWIAAAWAGLLCAFTIIAWRWRRRIFLGHALLMGAAIFFRTLLHNFYERSYFPPPSIWWGGWMTVGTTVALVFVALLVARRMKLPRPETDASQVAPLRRAIDALGRNPAPVFFYISFVLFAGLLLVELREHGMATVGWGAEAVATFLFALYVKERLYRLSALGLLLVCIGKIAFVDVWRLQGLERDLTILLLGAAIFSVSFLYTRYKDVLKAYL